jgi:hypothetical protein
VRTALRIAIVAAALAALLATLAVTPVGWRIASAGLRAAVRGRGLDLSIGTLSGNLFRRVTIEGVALREPDGPTIASIERIEAEYALGGLVRRHIVVSKLRVTGAELLFVVGRDGKLVGWPRFAGRSGRPARVSGAPWTADVSLETVGLRAAFRDSAATFDLGITDVAVLGRGGPQAYSVSVEGLIALSTERLADRVTGTFSVRAGGDRDRFTLEPTRVVTDVGEAAASGQLVGGDLRLAFDASADLARLGTLLGLLELDGTATASGTVSGPFGSLAYRASAAGRDLAYGAVSVPSLDVDLSGTPRELAVDRLVADFAGGAVEASARADFAPAGRPGLRDIEFEARARGLDLAAIAASLPDSVAPLSGALTASVTGRADSLSLAGVSAVFDVEVADLAAADTDIGPLHLTGSLESGRLAFAGECLATGFQAVGAVGTRGVETLDATLETADLSVAAAAFGAPGVGGRGTAVARLANLAAAPATRATPTADAQVSLQELRLGRIQAGPATASASGPLAALDVSLEAFAGALRASGTLEEGRSYSFAVSTDSLAVSLSEPDTASPSLDVSIEVTATGEINGAIGRGFAAAGTVERAALAVGRERLTLVQPAHFSASEDSLELSNFVFSGPLGEIAIGGRLDAGGENDLIARLTRLDVARAAALPPGARAVSLGGFADGTVTVLGSGAGRRVAADVGIRDLAVGGVVLDAVALTAESDSTDLRFEVEAISSQGGTMTASGAIPVKPDPMMIIVLDPGREFGVSVVWSRFVVAGGEEFLPGIPGKKRFELVGSVLLAGTADSLASLYGRGRFDGLDVELERIAFSLASPFDVEVVGGDVAITDASVVATRRRVLGDTAGGSVRVSGTVARDGALALDLSLDRVDVGQLLSAFALDAGGALEGRLDGRASLRGTLAAPEGDISGVISSPAIYGVGFTDLSGEARLTPDAVLLDRLALAAPGGVVTASGTVPLPPRGARAAGSGGSVGREGGLTLRVSTSSFDLAGLTALPQGILEAAGTLSADFAVAGSVAAPSLQGTLAVREGLLRAAALAQPVRDITVDVVVDGDAVALKDARASLGRGGVVASGFAQPFGPGEHPFWVSVKLGSPEITVPQMMEAKLGGEVTWAGSDAGSKVSGGVRLEKLDITQGVGLGDILAARPVRSVRPRVSDPRGRVALDIDVAIPDEISVRSNLADLGLTGGLHVGGTLLSPQMSGGVYADGGTFRYLDNTFTLENLNVSFVDPRRRDPYVDLLGTAEITSRSDEPYSVTLRVAGFAYDAIPELSSSPSLSEPDILALLTFGDTMGAMVPGGGGSGSSGDRWSALTRKAFLGGVFGVAENTMERLLNLDTIEVERDALESGELAGAGVTVGKRFGDRLRVDYTTALGRFGRREVDVALKLTKVLSIETRADPEGNHAVGFRLSLPFE